MQAALLRWKVFQQAVRPALAPPVLATNQAYYTSLPAASDSGDSLYARQHYTSTVQPSCSDARDVSLPTRALQSAIRPAVCAALQRNGYAVRHWWAYHSQCAQVQ